MQLQLFLEMHFPAQYEIEVRDIAVLVHSSLRSLRMSDKNTFHCILICPQVADVAKFGEFIKEKEIPVVYYVENPSMPDRYNYIPKQSFE